MDFMIKKIVFAGCSMTAGAELYQEKYVDNYANLEFDDAVKAFTRNDETRAYNLQHSYPSIVGNILGVSTENIAIDGISNKEIAMRALSHFSNDWYEDTVAVIQITTHNRMLVHFEENDERYLARSYVIQPVKFHGLSLRRSNLLLETYLEFMSESLLMIENYMCVLYAVAALKAKNISTFVIKIAENELNQPRNEPHENANSNKPIYINERHPLARDEISEKLIKDFESNQLSTCVLETMVSQANPYLPQWHFNHQSHHQIAEHISEKIKCLNL